MSCTKLEAYTLHHDGTIVVDPDQLIDILLSKDDLVDVYVSELTEDVKRFNDLSDYNISQKTTDKEIQISWNLPEQYLQFDLTAFMEKVILPRVQKDHLYHDRLERVITELELWEANDAIPVLRVLSYVIDTFNKCNVVWGVGRGSSCASYILYLLDVHLVDPVLYNIPITEFFKK